MPKSDGLDYQARFWTYVNKDGPLSFVRGEWSNCWLWTGGKNSKGYGYFFVGPDRKSSGKQAHVLVWDWEYGPLPKGLERDHLCRQHACVRLLHIEAVTRRENQLRGNTICARNAAKTHCKEGHPYDRKHKNGGRICSICINAQSRARRARGKLNASL